MSSHFASLMRCWIWVGFNLEIIVGFFTALRNNWPVAVRFDEWETQIWVGEDLRVVCFIEVEVGCNGSNWERGSLTEGWSNGGTVTSFCGKFYPVKGSEYGRFFRDVLSRQGVRAGRQECWTVWTVCNVCNLFSSRELGQRGVKSRGLSLVHQRAAAFELRTRVH